MERKRLNILAVDDMAPICCLLKAIIDKEGHNSYRALDGAQAIDILEAVNIHLVFLDLKLPVVNGMEVLKKTREMANRPRFVVMTGLAEPEIIDRALKYGASGYIAKPFNIDDIRGIIRETVKHKASKEEY